MRSHTHLGRREIERDLNRNNHPDVCQSPLRMRRVAMSQQKSRPCTDDAHNGARRANQLNRVYETYQCQTDNACAGGKP